MKIYYTPQFKELLETPDQNLELGKFKLGSYPIPVYSLEDIDWKYMNQRDSGRSPTDGWYEFGSVWSEDVLTLSVKIPKYDIGLLNEEYYKIIYAVYTNLASGQEGLAFILYIPSPTALGPLEMFPLRLGREVNIINIPGFKKSCTLRHIVDEDTEFLEGSGLGKYWNIWSAPELGQGQVDTRYVSKISYDSYRLEQKSSDSEIHFGTTFINKFGIKIY